MLRFITTWVLDICTSMLCSHIILSVLKSFSWSMCPLFSTDYGKWCLHSSKMQSVKRWPGYHISNLLQICTKGNVCCKLVNLLNNTLQFTWAQMSVIWMRALLQYLMQIVVLQIVFVDNKKLQETLLADIDADQLPSDYGGSGELILLQDAAVPNWPPVTQWLDISSWNLFYPLCAGTLCCLITEAS